MIFRIITRHYNGASGISVAKIYFGDSIKRKKEKERKRKKERERRKKEKEGDKEEKKEEEKKKEAANAASFGDNGLLEE